MPPSATQRRQLQLQLDQAQRLIAAGQYEAAHRDLSSIVCQDPGNLLYVELLLTNLHRLPARAPWALSRWLVRRALRRAAERRDWQTVWERGFQSLAFHPRDAETYCRLAGACAALEFDEVERLYLHHALQAAPDQAKVVRQAAESLTRMGHFQAARDLWHRVLVAEPADVVARRMVDELSHRPTQNAVDEDEQATERLRQLVDSDPSNATAAIELTERLVADGRFEEALATLKKAHSAAAADPRLLEQFERLQIAEAQANLQVAERQAEAGVAGAELLAEELHSTLNRLELEIFAARRQRYPSDRDVAFQLGLRLKRAGNYREAMAEFEESSKSQQLTAAACLHQGECLQHLRQFERALEHYQRAAQMAESAENIDTCLLGSYRAAVLAEAMQRWEPALSALQRIQALDGSYRDAADRLDKIRRMRHKD